VEILATQLWDVVVEGGFEISRRAIRNIKGSQTRPPGTRDEFGVGYS
jgi:hypothetical protein